MIGPAWWAKYAAYYSADYREVLSLDACRHCVDRNAQIGGDGGEMMGTPTKDILAGRCS
jgi:hypothetical protein